MSSCFHYRSALRANRLSLFGGDVLQVSPGEGDQRFHKQCRERNYRLTIVRAAPPDEVNILRSSLRRGLSLLTRWLQGDPAESPLAKLNYKFPWCFEYGCYVRNLLTVQLEAALRCESPRLRAA